MDFFLLPTPPVSLSTARPRSRGVAVSLALVLTGLLAACDPDTASPQPLTPATTGMDGSSTGGTVDNPTSGEDAGVTTPPGTGDGGADDGGGENPGTGAFTLSLPSTATALTEGGDAVELAVGVARTAGDTRTITLSVEDDLGGLVSEIAPPRLTGGNSGTTLRLSLPIGVAPRPSGSRTVRLVAVDDGGARVAGDIALDITPTTRPDIYLLVGQSNMVGSSRTEFMPTRDASPGGPDERNARIEQLNVTNNERERFPTPAAYTDVNLIADAERRIVPALDPLHDRDSDGANPKSGTTIGLGLTFAKQALADTTANIVLVPAAWSDTGFCRRASSRFDGATGWNAAPPASDVFAGTLLYDRAVARANLAIAETGGILRGILWHQGEADSDNDTCSRAYDDNLRRMVEGLRSEIVADARGPGARGPEVDIPFIVGTMSKGSDPRDKPFAPFSEVKARVDSAHRNIASIVPFSGVVDADDLVPPSYPCGNTSCIHFGGEALRELGVRYYRVLRELVGGS